MSGNAQYEPAGIAEVWGGGLDGAVATSRSRTEAWTDDGFTRH